MNKSKRKSSESWKQLSPSSCAHDQPHSTQELEAGITDGHPQLLAAPCGYWTWPHPATTLWSFTVRTLFEARNSEDKQDKHICILCIPIYTALLPLHKLSSKLSPLWPIFRAQSPVQVKPAQLCQLSTGDFMMWLIRTSDFCMAWTEMSRQTGLRTFKILSANKLWLNLNYSSYLFTVIYHSLMVM